jgi:hypothetical protein
VACQPTTCHLPPRFQKRSGIQVVRDLFVAAFVGRRDETECDEAGVAILLMPMSSPV